jgi:arsenite methyltransferase
LTVLDIGFGTGFPLLEMAQRLGNTCTIYGIDPWKEAIARVKQKIEILQIKNVHLVEGDAAAMDFPDNTFDLIVSNTGINNFAHVPQVLTECWRVAKSGAHIALTTNPVGHMDEFYHVYEETLNARGLDGLIKTLHAQRDHRLSIKTIGSLLQQAGFRLTATHSQTYVMRFVDGTAFFNHHLIRLGFLEGWKNILPPQEVVPVFTALEERLNTMAREMGELRMTVPVVCIEAEK